MRSPRLTALLLTLSLVAVGCLEDDSPHNSDAAATIDGSIDAGPVPESSASTIGAAGGVVALEGVLLRVPKGALAADVELRIEPLGSTSRRHRLQSPVYQFSPAGLTFLKPVELEMNFVGSGEWTQIFWSKPSGPAAGPRCHRHHHSPARRLGPRH